MAGLLNILGKLFGNKYDKDIKEISPIVEEIKSKSKDLAHLTNDEIRQQTINLKQQINDFIKEERQQIQELKEKTKEVPPEKKEALYTKIDDLEKKVLEKIEEILNIILPTAFAVVKETARRFSENEVIEVTASDNDKD